MKVHCTAYAPQHAPALVGLWNDIFREQRNFTPLTVDGWRQRIEVGGEGDPGAIPLDPELFRIAWVGDEIVGFLHGGLWGEQWCAALFPHKREKAIGYLACIGVATAHRRQGIGRQLLASLRSTVNARLGRTVPLCVDGRMFNPYYGNGRAPVAPPWGTPEGIAVPAEDAATASFLRQAGFQLEQRAVSLVAELPFVKPPDSGPQDSGPQDSGPQDSGPQDSGPQDSGPHAAETEVRQNYSPILGTDLGEPFLQPNASRTWLLRVGRDVAGAVVAYPLASATWGIHTLQVHPDHEGRGIGTALITQLLHDLSSAQGASGPVQSVEVLALPDESPGAERLYRKCGFRPVATWGIWA